MSTGIIAEFNPFHNGHKHLLEQVQKQDADGIVVAMSGSITQRGDFAVLDKWQRAEAAVANGANLVLELPFVFACRSAQHFAAGGIRLLNALGIVDKLAFGTEYPYLTLLTQAAAFKPEDYPEELAAKLQEGQSYGRAVSNLMADKLTLPEKLLTEPNTILAIEYIRSILQYCSYCSENPFDNAQRATSLVSDKFSLNFPSQCSMKPVPIPRTGTGHNEQQTAGKFASGTYIRKLIYDNKLQECLNYMPAPLENTLENTLHFPSQEKMFALTSWQLLSLPPEKIRYIYGINEGLEQRLRQTLPQPSLETFLAAAASKRYSAARLRRSLMYVLLHFTQEQAMSVEETGPLYVRVLAFDDKGRKMLKKIKERTTLPVITKTANYINDFMLQHPAQQTLLQQMLALDIAACNLREFCSGTLAAPQQNIPYELNKDFLISPAYIRNYDCKHKSFHQRLNP